MALKKVKELPSGVQGEYWKIVEAKADKLKLELIVKISLFKDKVASDSGKINLGLSHSFSGKQSKQALSGDLTALGYEMIKEQCLGNSPSAISGKLMAYNDLKNSEDS